MSKLRQTAAGGRFLSLVTLAIILLGFAVPAHAADDNTVSITVDPSAELKPVDNLYKATTNVTVKTSKPYGFNLTMQADTADLLNSKDPTHKISYVPSDRPTELGANQWGYSLDKNATKFSMVIAKDYSNVPHQSGKPTPSYAPSVIIDTAVKRKQAGCNCKDHCDTTVTFAANVDLAKLASGSYSTTVTYTATSKPAPKPPVVDPTVCKSGNPKNDCQVDIDANMIPVKYTGTTTNAQWTSLSNPEDSSNQGNWYNYNQKQWANAVTVKDPSKYKNQTKVVDQADILGYWVYIPRYAYEVMRRDGTDKPVPVQNFLISFEKASTPKRRPAACSTTGKDYRTQCDLDRDYIKGQPSNQGTWATHPAFTFGKKELNGIWFAKFETTGTDTQPTVLPGQSHICNEYIGTYYSVSKSLGVYDPRNVGGFSVSTTQNNHHLAKLSSHMVNNNDWGAATYLSASKYGAGYNGVQINANGAEHNSSYGTTGCGPQSNGDTSSYSDSGTLGTPQACGNADRAYNGTLGQLASTTNNPTGIYDMSGGGYEYAAASYSDSLNNSNTNSYFGSNAAHPPYVNTYNIANLTSCTFNTCGGQALYETNNGTGDGSGSNQWNSQWLGMGGFASYAPWFNRGSHYDFGSNAGLFYANNDIGGNGNGVSAFRVALAPLQD